MQQDQRWKSSSFFEAYRHALAGVLFGVRAERNMRIQIFILLVTVLLALGLGFSAVEVAVVLLAAGLVLSLELINTAAEELANVVQPEHSERVRNLKDVTAGAVLLASIFALLSGLLLFGSRVLFLLS